MATQEETQKIYEVIEEALLSLCQEKPNDPVDYLSRKMLQLIGDDPTSAIRKKNTMIEGNVTENIVLSPDKIAIQNLKKDFYENYKILEQISINNYLIEDLKLGDANGQKCARIIDKSNNRHKILMSDRIITTLVKLSHPNLIKIIEILEDEKYFYVIYDYCPGKDLFNYFYSNRSNMSEGLIRKALTQILSALGYLHRSGVIYKNLIPSKVLVYNKEFDPNDIQIKLGDLIYNTEIFSKINYIYSRYDNLIQDPLFIAPEYLEKKYNHKVDIWGVGMLAYLLFVGRPPFKGPKHKIIYQIANNDVEYPINLDEVKKSLLQKMLAKNPNDRYDADSLLKEGYFHQEMDESMDEAKAGKGFLNVVNSISSFTVGKNLRKSAMSYIIARKLYNENDQKLRKIFEALDSDHNGYIDKKELLREYNKYFPGTTKKQLKVINNFLETADVDNNGKIDYAEFLTAMNLGNKEISRTTLREVFDYYDHDKNGVIEAKDIKEIFEDTGLNDKEIHDLIDEVDLNEDRALSFEEFYKLITAAI